MDVNAVINNLISNQTEGSRAAVSMMRTALGSVMTRARNEVAATLEEETAEAVKSLSSSLSSELVSVGSSWISDAQGQLALVPDNTRYFGREGENMTIIVEEKPTVRTVNFHDRQFALALPFMQFTLNYTRHNNRSWVLGDLRATCSKTPVTSLNNPVHITLLPNTGSACNVCTGGVGVGVRVNNDCSNLVEAVNTVLNGYWQSVFNTDLSDNFRAFLRSNFSLGDQGNVDYRSATGRNQLFAALGAWQARTRENPLFILASDVQFSTGYTLRQMLRSDLHSRSGSAGMATRIRNTITSGVTSVAERVGRSITFDLSANNLESIHLQTLNSFVSRTLSDGFSHILQTVTQEHRVNVREWEANRTTQERSLTQRESRIERDRAAIQRERDAWRTEKLQQQMQLHQASVYLQAKIAEAEARARGEGVAVPATPPVLNIPEPPAPKRRSRSRAAAPATPVTVQDVVLVQEQQPSQAPVRHPEVQAAVQGWRELIDESAPAPVHPAGRQRGARNNRGIWTGGWLAGAFSDAQ